MSTPSAPSCAAIQMTSRADVAANLATARHLLEAAAGAGAALAALPENFAHMGVKERDKLSIAESDGAGPIQDFLAETAARLKLWIVAGTVPLRVKGEVGRPVDLVWPACLVHDAAGSRVARYDKIHLFDIEVPDRDGGGRGETYRESATIARGDATQAVVVATPVGKLGLSVCYDVRFPELYRRLVAAGAEMLCVPAAFTERTGRAHWQALLTARAVENQCHVIAPAQCGTHDSGRRTFGHSLILDPWGEVLADAGEGEGFALAAIDAARRDEVRATFPALTHRRIK